MAAVVLLNTPGTTTWFPPADCPVGTAITVACTGAGSTGSTTNTTYTVDPHDIASGIGYTVGSGTGTSTWGSANTLNLMTNSVLAGAVVGTPGTLPSSVNYGLGAGLTTSVVGFGTDPVLGVPYIDFGVSGTGTGIQFQIVISNLCTSSNAVYAASFYCSLRAGGLTGLTFQLGSDALASGPTYVGSPIGLTFTPNATLTRISASATYPATTLTSNIYANILYSASTVISFTLRLAAPQYELGSTTTFFKSTPGAASAAGGGTSANGRIQLTYTPVAFPPPRWRQLAPILAQ